MNMFGKKRGLSDVVTVTLIILLAISAVVIVWVFVRSTLLKVGGQIEGGQCISIDVKPVSCTGGTGVVIVANGPGDTIVQKVKLIYYASGTSDTAVRDADCINIEPLAQKTCIPQDPDAAGPLQAIPDFNPNVPDNQFERAGVAAVVGDSVCSASTETVLCP